MPDPDPPDPENCDCGRCHTAHRMMGIAKKLPNKDGAFILQLMHNHFSVVDRLMFLEEIVESECSKEEEKPMRVSRRERRRRR